MATEGRRAPGLAPAAAERPVTRYFPNEEAVFGEILESVTEELRESVSGSWTKGEELASLRESSRRYLEAYHRNRQLIAGLIDMAAANPEVDRRWWELRNRTFERKERYLDRALPGEDLDPAIAAVALGSMIEQFAFTHSSRQSVTGVRCQASTTLPTP